MCFRFSFGSGILYTRRFPIVRGAKVVMHNKRNPAQCINLHFHMRIQNLIWNLEPTCLRWSALIWVCTLAIESLSLGTLSTSSFVVLHIVELVQSTLYSIHTLCVHNVHVTSNLIWRYSKYAKVARVYFCVIALHVGSEQLTQYHARVGVAYICYHG